MLEAPVATAPRTAGRGGQRFPALVWALLHVPLLLVLYFQPVAAAVASVPPAYRGWLWPTFLPQALVVGLLPFLCALPLSRWPRLFRFTAPALAGLLTVVLALDSQVYGAVGFHLNGFFLRIVMQPKGLAEVGVTAANVATFLIAALGWVLLDALVGAWFIRRFARPARAWTLAVAILVLGTVERIYGQGLTHFAGPAVFAASGVLPLQVPVRMSRIMRKVFGGRRPDPFAKADALRLPAGIPASEIRFERKPDVLFVVAESLPHDHLDERTLPNVWRHAAAEGARFTRHYSTASATHYALFSLMYGIQAQKLEATVGAGRRPMLFPAFRENGYDVRILAASCVDWMGLKETVFGGVQDALETWCENAGDVRDRQMMARAREITASTPRDRPLFLFLFYVGSHFDYVYAPQDKLFEPEWDGRGGIKATTADGASIKNRARNSARTVDRLLEEFLVEFEAKRGRAPLVVFTGDHGEEFRQKGHIGHGSDVTDEQVHVPAAIFGPGAPRGVFDAPTSHVDFAPTLFSLLGDRHPPSLYADGMDMFQVPQDRFVVATVGWEPRYAVIGRDLKLRMYAGLGTADITDPDDRPLPDGPQRLAANAARMMRALRGDPEPAAAQAQPSAVAPANASTAH
jgi:uncharacterized protein